MSVDILDTSNGILEARITGKLTQPGLATLQQAAARMIQIYGKIRLFTVVENFEGWDRESDWSDVSFQKDNDDFIERMAIVGERKWEQLALIFSAKGLRPFPIEYFESSDIERARNWIKGP